MINLRDSSKDDVKGLYLSRDIALKALDPISKAPLVPIEGYLGTLLEVFRDLSDQISRPNPITQPQDKPITGPTLEPEPPYYPRFRPKKIQNQFRVSILAENIEDVKNFLFKTIKFTPMTFSLIPKILNSVTMILFVRKDF